MNLGAWPKGEEFSVNDGTHQVLKASYEAKARNPGT
jgi:hypothetical protein